MNHMLSPDNHDVIKINKTRCDKISLIWKLEQLLFSQRRFARKPPIASFQQTHRHHILSPRQLFWWSNSHISGITQFCVSASDVVDNKTSLSLRQSKEPTAHHTQIKQSLLLQVYIEFEFLIIVWVSFEVDLVIFFNCFSALKFLCCNDFSVSFSDFPRRHSKKRSLQLFMYDM